MSKILVVGPSWVGDTVLAQPLIMRLRAASANTQVDVLAPPWTVALLQRMPEVGEVIENPFKHGELKVFARRRLGMDLRARRYDAAIILPNSLKSALPPFFASIPVRTGYRGEMRLGLLNDVRNLDERRLPTLAERFAALAQPPGTLLHRPLPRPHLRTDPSNRARVLKSQGLTLERPIAAFCPGAEYGAAKRWPTEHYARLAERLLQAGLQVWLIGSPNDAAIGADIAAGVRGPGVTNLCGRTSLADAIDLLSAATVVVSNDSGLMHVAAALDRPLVALYGSSSPGYTPPLSQDASILSLQLPCSPCFKRECPLGHLRCLHDLDPEQVWQEIVRRNIAGAGINASPSAC